MNRVQRLPDIRSLFLAHIFIRSYPKQNQLPNDKTILRKN